MERLNKGGEDDINNFSDDMDEENTPKVYPPPP